MGGLFVRAIWVWVVFFVLAVLNGMLRESVYIPEWGNMGGRISGTAILIAVMALVMYVFLRRNAERLTRFRLVLVGLLWLGLSLFFEFAVSHWVMEESWELVQAHYDVMNGRFHVLVRLAEFAGPIVLGGGLLPGRTALGVPAPVAAAPAVAPEATTPADPGAGG